MRLTRAQINKAINDLIKTEFPGIEIQSSDVEEGFKRPSFFVSLETTDTEAFQRNARRDLTCHILYFPRDRYVYKEEAYDVQDRLESLFGLNLSVGDRTITINDAQSDIVDKVLHFDFNFSYYEAVDLNETGDLMDELSFNG